MRQFTAMIVLLALIIGAVGCINNGPPIAEGSPLNEMPVKWLDSSRQFEERATWEDTFELELPEFPGVIFTGSWVSVTATDQNGERLLFSGMPIHDVYLADITGDGLPDFVATASSGSGIVWGHVIVYDFANDELYELSKPLVFYDLLIENGDLIVTLAGGSMGEELIGELAIINGELTIVRR